ncbi:MAG: hypothetical protein Q4C96_00540 [Planctomycetia bacterium]|nr:hypothetical protein [Planctomycetia bacterium]
MSEQKNFHFSHFVGQYSLHKTLCFELRPVGATRKHIKNLNLISKDQKKETDFQNAKNLIDDIHRYFIERVLFSEAASKIIWQEIAELTREVKKNSDPSIKNILNTAQKKKREEISKIFSDFKITFETHSAKTCQKKKKQEDITEKKEILFSKKRLCSEALFSEIIPYYWDEILADSVKTEEKEKQYAACMTFKKSSTYFTGFYKNRENIYAAEKQGVSLAWRITNENFPKFLANIDIFQKIQQECPEILEKTEKELSKILDGKRLDEIFRVEYYSYLMSQTGIEFYNTILGGNPSEATGQRKLRIPSRLCSFSSSPSEATGQRKLQGLNEAINLWRQKNPEKAKRISFMSPLYAQILSDRQKKSFIGERYLEDTALLEAIQEFHDILVPN